MTQEKRLFMDIHVIQTLPPSNINRDDTGSPKTASYGGVRRARVSSQSWKKAMRDYFRENMEDSNIGVRTLEIVRYVANKILEKDNKKSMDDAMKLAEKAFNDAGVKTKDGKAKALFFLGDKQAEKIAELIVSGESQDKKQLQEILNDNVSMDIALFGRMVADDPYLNEDASSQIAHAISTHAVQNEFDYFTAIDDYSQRDDAGAGMLGNVEFNSSTLYRYGNIALHEFYKQLDNDEEALKKSVKLFIEAFCKSLPTGKVNTFANQTLPQLVFVVLRKDRPVNIVSAFEEPVKSRDGYVKKSIEELVNEIDNIQQYIELPKFSAYIMRNEFSDVSKIENLGEKKNNLSELIEKILENIEI